MGGSARGGVVILLPDCADAFTTNAAAMKSGNIFLIANLREVTEW
jgi:hypothetical protein